MNKVVVCVWMHQDVITSRMSNKSLIICINKRANPMQPSCGARGSIDIANKLEQAISVQKLPITLVRQKCLGMCESGPNLKLAPSGKFYNHVTDECLANLLVEVESFCKEKL